MLPDRVSNPGPLTYESNALPIALRGPAWKRGEIAPWEQFMSFPTIFSIYILLTKGVKLQSFVKFGCSNCFFSSILQI